MTLNLISKLLLFLSFFFVLETAIAQRICTLDKNGQRTYLGEFAHIYSSENAVSNLDSLIQHAEFKENKEAIISFQASNFHHWIYLVFDSANTKDCLLEIEFPIPQEIDVHYRGEHGLFNTIEMGVLRGYEQRLFDYHTYIFPLNFANSKKNEILIRVKSPEQLNIPISVSHQEKLIVGLIKRDLIYGIYAGIILVMFLYNLFIWFTTRDSSYIYYIAYILFVGLVQTSLEGYGFKYIWTKAPLFQVYSLYIFNALTALFSVLFLNSFIQLRKKHPFWCKVLSGVMLLYALVIILVVFDQMPLAYNIMNFAALLLAISMLLASGFAAVKGSRQAKFFFVAWIFFLSAVVVFVLRDVGILPYNLFTSKVLQIGSALEVVLLSFGLADRINILKRENELSQKQALDISKENERIIREQNTLLEQKVSERTAKLKETYDTLNNAQMQLIEQEKMASLGQLTAGIAHEINNPINFVTANVKPLQRDIQDVFEVLDLYESIEIPEEFRDKKEEIEKLKEEIELDFVRQEIESLLKGVEDGALRTAEIVRGLKLFSRMDEQDLKRVDLIEGIESTITLLNSNLKGRIAIERNYDNIPKVECLAGKINQVFMNILGNAIYALDKKEGLNQGLIKIQVKNLEKEVEIQIIDNGIGIPKDKLNRIFEPFFTTKGVGEGTGLGLSISKGIIDKHNGKISVSSELGVGTTFTILLPKLQQHENQ